MEPPASTGPLEHQRDPPAERADLGPGQAVEPRVRSMAEAAYGARLDHVTVHTGPDAVALARQRSAAAATAGDRIAFAPGAYRPGTLRGDALIAHELAHVVQQSVSGVDPAAARPGPAAAEHEADAAAVTAMRNQPRYRSAASREGIDLRAADAVAPSRPRRGLGARLQLAICSSEPDYGSARGGETSTEPTITHHGAREEQLGPSSRIERPLAGTGNRGVIDGDGDQSAELELRLQPRDWDRYYRRPGAVEISATRLGNTPQPEGPGSESHSHTFDLTDTRWGDWVTPQVVQRTDGREPTRIRVWEHHVSEPGWEIHPPSLDGPRADYRMVVTRPMDSIGATQSESHTYSFSRDPADIYPVFVPSSARRAGAIWVLDAQVGRFGDRFRFTFRKVPPQGGTVRMGISPMSDIGPLGVDQVDIPLTGQLDVRVLRSIGPLLEVDLDGDGRPDLRLHERVEPRSDWRSGSSYTDVARFRQLVITATNGDGTRVYGRASREVKEGRFTETSVHMESEFESLAVAATAEGLAASARTPDLAADLGAVTRQLNELRATAIGAELLTTEVSDAYDALTQRWLTLAGTPEGGDLRTPGRRVAEAATTFDRLWTDATSAGTRREVPFTGEGASASTEPRLVENPFTGYRRRVQEHNDQGYVWRTTEETATVAARIADAARTGDRATAGPLMSDLAQRMGRWLERVFRRAGRTEEAERAASLSALSGQLDQLIDRDPIRVPAVFHSAPEFVRGGAAPNLPMRLYVWRVGTTWHLQDLTHPTRRKSLGILRSSGGSETEPPHALFEQLNDADRFPKGYIHYQLPGEDGRAGFVRTTAPWRVSDVLGWIGLGFAAAALVAGSVLSGGTAAPVLVPVLWGLSAGFGAASAVSHMVEEHRQGRLDGSTIALDVVQIVGSISAVTVLASRVVTAHRLGQAARAAAAAGTTLAPSAATTLAPLGVGSLRVLLITQIAADSCQVVLMSEQLARNLADIERSGMSPADKLRAKIMAVGQFGLATGLAYVSVRATASELRTALASGGRVIQAGDHTLVPGLHSEARYAAELEAALGSSPALENMASRRVRVIRPEDAGSSLGLARIEFVNGKPQVVVVDGAPLQAIREEAIHLEQLALLSRPASTLTPAERQIRSAAGLVRQAATSWGSMSPSRRLAAHRARLTLEEDAQLRMIRRMQGEIDAGRAVNQADIDNAWQNLENLRQLQAEMVGVERAMAGGRALGDIDPQLAAPPSLYSKKTLATTEVDESWRNLTADAFVLAYQARYPNSTLTETELRLRHAMSRRLNPATGRLVDVNRAVPDVTATYRGDAESLPMTGPDRVQLSTAEDTQIRALLAERDAARQARDAAAASTTPDDAARHAAQYRMIEASRQLGEATSGMWVRRRYAGPPAPDLIYPTGGGSRSGDFDQVWRCTETVDGQTRTVWLVVEAKGGSSPLKSRRTAAGPRAEQGTTPYYGEILESMFAMGGEARAAARHLRLAGASEDAVVRYLHVQTPFSYSSTGGTQTSVIGDVRIREFDINPAGVTPHTTSTAPQP